jgi:hypothetical protein
MQIAVFYVLINSAFVGGNNLYVNEPPGFIKRLSEELLASEEGLCCM